MNGYIKVPVKVVSTIKIHSQKTVRVGKKNGSTRKGRLKLPTYVTTVPTNRIQNTTCSTVREHPCCAPSAAGVPQLLPLNKRGSEKRGTNANKPPFTLESATKVQKKGGGTLIKRGFPPEKAAVVIITI